LASPDIDALASRNITDDPGCGHRMIITTVNFKTTPKTCNKNPHYVRNFKRAKWHKYRKELDKNCENFATSFSVLQNSVYLRVKFQNINHFGQFY
jgi:hypothetical protein